MGRRRWYDDRVMVIINDQWLIQRCYITFNSSQYITWYSIMILWYCFCLYSMILRIWIRLCLPYNSQFQEWWIIIITIKGRRGVMVLTSTQIWYWKSWWVLSQFLVVLPISIITPAKICRPPIHPKKIITIVIWKIY